jgi:COMPASS component SPP1
MLQEKRDKAAIHAIKGNGGAASSSTTPASTLSTSASKVKVPPPRKPQTPKDGPSTSSREITPAAMDMAERIKTEGRPRKAASAAPSSERDTPAPSPAPKNSTAVPPPKPQKPGPKKGTAAPIKKQQDKKPLSKAKIGGTSRFISNVFLLLYLISSLVILTYADQSWNPIQLSSS